MTRYCPGESNTDTFLLVCIYLQGEILPGIGSITSHTVNCGTLLNHLLSVCVKYTHFPSLLYKAVRHSQWHHRKQLGKSRTRRRKMRSGRHLGHSVPALSVLGIVLNYLVMVNKDGLIAATCGADTPVRTGKVALRTGMYVRALRYENTECRLQPPPTTSPARL